MSFVVRQISHTADGRQIVRPSRLDKSDIVIGRAAESDIHLADLAVELRHAVLRLLAPGKLEIVAIGGLPVDLNGRTTMRAEIDGTRGANLRIGAHVLAIAPGEGDEAGITVVSVERVGALSEASEEKDEVRSFSLASAVPGKRAMAWTFALLVLALFLAWPIAAYLGNDEAEAGERREIAFHGDEMWSSGKLSIAHANLENNCKACHLEAGEPVQDASCVACHDTLHDHADPKRLAAAMPSPGLGQGLQRAIGGMFGVAPGRCVDCHTEHEGATAMPVTEQRFCSDCHDGLQKRLTDTAILDATDFGANHPQFRPAVMTSAGNRPIVQRLSLDARPLENHGLKFPHDIHLAKKGSVARMASTMKVEHGFGDALDCADCHVPDPSGARFVAVDMEKNCQMCHSLAYDSIGGTVRTLKHGDPRQVIADLGAFYRTAAPARPIYLGGMARRRPGEAQQAQAAADYRLGMAQRPAAGEAATRAAFTQGGVCFDCHEVTQLGPANFDIVPVRVPDRYMQKGWFDHKAHETETCASCHAATASRTSADLLLPKIANCQECHGGEGSKKAVPSSCAMCHDYHMDQGAPLMVRENRTRGKRDDPTRPGTRKTSG